MRGEGGEYKNAIIRENSKYDLNPLTNLINSSANSVTESRSVCVQAAFTRAI